MKDDLAFTSSARPNMAAKKLKFFENLPITRLSGALASDQ
jgi:hypothetical protein